MILHFQSFFEGTMPRNLLEQILVHIVRLSAEDYTQQEVARMLGWLRPEKADSSVWNCTAQKVPTQENNVRRMLRDNPNNATR